MESRAVIRRSGPRTLSNPAAVKLRNNTANTVEIVQAYLAGSVEVYSRTARDCLAEIVDAAAAIAVSLRRKGKILICGNGGSAADSQHLASEFVSILNKSRMRPAMAAIALTTDTSIITAIGNDFGYVNIFQRQVEALGRPGDVLVGISTSGNSENVLRAIRQARRMQIRTVALTGRRKGPVSDAAEITIAVASDDTQHIQEVHIAVEHLLGILTEQELFGRAEP